jgi:hypothetical protein
MIRQATLEYVIWGNMAARGFFVFSSVVILICLISLFIVDNKIEILTYLLFLILMPVIAVIRDNYISYKAEKNYNSLNGSIRITIDEENIIREAYEGNMLDNIDKYPTSELKKIYRCKHYSYLMLKGKNRIIMLKNDSFIHGSLDDIKELKKKK